MSEPFMTEIKIVSFNFPPKGWAECNGQLLPINQNQALFSLLGTTYGGNGQTNFALPNLRGQAPIHMGSGYTLGQAGGASAVTLTQQEMPQHLHFLQGVSADANVKGVTNDILARSVATPYSLPGSSIAFPADAVTSVGGSQAHNNMMPYLVLNFIIALQGIFPSQN